MRDDVTLLLLVKNGDHTAFAELYQRWRGPLFAMACKQLNNPDDANDVVQQAFSRLWIVREKISDNPSIGYLRTFLFHGCQDLLRKRNTERWNKTEYLNGATDKFIPLSYENKELHEIIVTGFQLLPEKLRTVCEMAFIHRLSAKEMSERMHVSLQYIRNQLVIGREMLQTHILSQLNFKADQSSQQQTTNVDKEERIRADMSSIIDSLPPQMQKAMKMSMDENMDAKEIARVMNVSVRTIQRHITDARRKLDKQLTGGKRKRF